MLIRVTKIVLIVLAASIVIVSLAQWTNNDLTSVVDDFLLQAKDENFEAARGHLSAGLQEEISTDELVAYAERLPALKNHESIDYRVQSIDDGTAKFEGDLMTAANNRRPVTLSLVETDQGWVIDALTLDNVPLNQTTIDRILIAPE